MSHTPPPSCCRFLPKFKKKNIKRKKPAAKPKKDYTPFPPQQQPSKVGDGTRHCHCLRGSSIGCAGVAGDQILQSRVFAMGKYTHAHPGMLSVCLSHAWPAQ
jgi:hypothetical protein